MRSSFIFVFERLCDLHIRTKKGKLIRRAFWVFAVAKTETPHQRGEAQRELEESRLVAGDF
ncbi:hypothetical protein BOO23_12420 [Vibrio navarrensis]|nr:hypothetical protein [Vibrio navarrensis]